MLANKQCTQQNIARTQHIVANTCTNSNSSAPQPPTRKSFGRFMPANSCVGQSEWALLLLILKAFSSRCATAACKMRRHSAIWKRNSIWRSVIFTLYALPPPQKLRPKTYLYSLEAFTLTNPQWTACYRVVLRESSICIRRQQLLPIQSCILARQQPWGASHVRKLPSIVSVTSITHSLI